MTPTMREALQRLVNRLDEIHADPHYKSVWELYMLHGGDYTNGPKYDKELEAARTALAAIDREAELAAKLAEARRILMVIADSGTFHIKYPVLPINVAELQQIAANAIAAIDALPVDAPADRQDELERLRAAIEKYGLAHLDGCPWAVDYWSKPCDCGQAETLAALAETKGGTA